MRVLGALMAMAFLAGCSSGSEADAPSESTGTAASTETSAPTTSTRTRPSPPDTTPVGPPYLGPLTFNWPVDCSVPVWQTLHFDDTTVQIAYRLRMSRDGVDGLALSFVDVAFISSSGEPIDDDEEALEAGVMPDFAVDGKGAFVGVRNTDRAIAALKLENPSIDDDDVRSYEQGMAYALEHYYWEKWAGLIGSGPIEKSDDSFIWYPKAGDTTVAVPSAIRSLGTTASGTAVLEAVTVVEGDAFLALKDQLFDQYGLLDEVGAASFDSATGRRQVSFRNVVDPARMTPTFASFREDIEVQADSGTFTHMLAGQWEFDWASSDCAM